MIFPETNLFTCNLSNTNLVVEKDSATDTVQLKIFRNDVAKGTTSAICNDVVYTELKMAVREETSGSGEDEGKINQRYYYLEVCHAAGRSRTPEDVGNLQTLQAFAVQINKMVDQTRFQTAF